MRRNFVCPEHGHISISKVRADVTTVTTKVCEIKWGRRCGLAVDTPILAGKMVVADNIDNTITNLFCAACGATVTTSKTGTAKQ